MSHSPLPVPGYTQQGDAAIMMVAENKMLEEMVMRQIDRHAVNTEVDQRMVALARTKMQEAYMWLNRSVFQPTRLIGPLDVDEITKKLGKKP